MVVVQVVMNRRGEGGGVERAVGRVRGERDGGRCSTTERTTTRSRTKLRRDIFWKIPSYCGVMLYVYSEFHLRPLSQMSALSITVSYPAEEMLLTVH